MKLYVLSFEDGNVDELTSTLRMSPATYNTLLTLLRPGLTKKNTNMRKCISAEARLLLTLC